MERRGSGTHHPHKIPLLETMKKITENVSKIISHPLARGSAIVLVGSTLANVGAYAYHLVVGRMLGPVSYGELASLFSFSYILNVPSSVLQTVLTRYISEFYVAREFGKAKNLSVTMLKRLAVIISIGGIVIVPFIGFLADFLHIREPVSVFYMYLTSAIWLLTVVQASLMQGTQLFTSAMVLMNVTTVLRLIGGTIGAMFGVVETVFASVLAGLIGFVTYYIPLGFIYKAKSTNAGIGKKEFVSYSMPSFIALLGITSLYSVDIMLAKHFLPPLEAGYYAALSVMGKIIFFASSSVSYVLFPVIAARTKQKSDSQLLVYSALAAVAIVSFGITLGYFLFPNLALKLLFGALYYPAASYLGWMGVFLSFYSLCYVLVMTLLGRSNTVVWRFVALAGIGQIIAIFWFHNNMMQIITANIFVAIGLFVSLLVYYCHAIQKH